MKILSIGNSFSQDAQRYLYELAKKDGIGFKTVNLYIGACTLRTHYLNVLENNADYFYEMNGIRTGLKVSIREALASDDWDVITLQQASHESTKIQTYSPYLEELALHVKKYCPHAKIYIHQTWAYEENSARLTSIAGYTKAEDMFLDIIKAYKEAVKTIKADGLIPSGTAMFNATKLGIEKVHRDTFHASLGVGRYLLALTWYKALTGKNIDDNDFNDFDERVTDEERKIAIKAVNMAFNNKK